MQAYPLSKDHKPDIENEKERILKAGGFIQVGRVNGSLNLARAIGTYISLLGEKRKLRNDLLSIIVV